MIVVMFCVNLCGQCWSLFDGKGIQRRDCTGFISMVNWIESYKIDDVTEGYAYATAVS